jgi:prepilin-type N-terminal cleavage/methylation domain-containing protein
MTLRDERGFTLLELLVVMSLALVILGATLTAFNAFERRSKQTQTLNDAAQVARNSMDHAAHQLRNLANQDPSQKTTTIALAKKDDLVFQTSDPSRKWVRYCLATTSTGIAGTTNTSTSRARLWESETNTSATPTAAMLGACPGSLDPSGTTGWVKRTVVADYVVNKYGRDLPTFSYSCAPTAPSCDPLNDTNDYARITNINAQIVVDPNPGRSPAELRVVSGIYLRNQNEKPVASFTYSPVAGSPKTVILNASSSSDPEARTLAYDWFLGNGTVTLTPEEACALDIKQKANGSTLVYLGQGVTYRYTSPTSGAKNIQLVVRDPGCLYDSKVQAVTIP